MRAKLVAHFEIDDTYFKNEEEKELFNKADFDNKLTWLKNKCLEEKEFLIESDIELQKYLE